MPVTHDTISSAAAALGIPLQSLRWAKKNGCPAFRNGRVIEEPLLEWMEHNPPPTDEHGEVEATNVNEKLKAEQARYWQLRNQRATALLVERAWVVEQFQKAGGELHTLRAKSEAEHAMLFATACPGADVAACRSILRGIWGDVFKIIEGIGVAFEEAPGSTSTRNMGVKKGAVKPKQKGK